MPASSAPTPPPGPPAAAPGQAVRHLGRFQLMRLLGKTARTMHWLVHDPKAAAERVLVIPRARLEDEEQLSAWQQQAQRAGRIRHPALVEPVEFGDAERWPYMAYDREQGVLLAESLGHHGLPVADLVPAVVQLLEGLAFAHESGLVHRDPSALQVMVVPGGQLRWIGFGVAAAEPGEGHGLVAQRKAAERDVLAAGLLLHQALAGRAALDEPDLTALAARMGQASQASSELVRLPWQDIQPVAEPLRAIVNRATDRQERQRYRSARTFARALQGWLQTTGDGQEGPLALLQDRMRTVGLLPAGPGGRQLAKRLLLLERERVDQLAEQVLEDVGMSFELMRAVNVAIQRVGAVSGNGPILTVRRAIEMLGLKGVQRAAQALKPWPGPLNEAQAADLAQQLEYGRAAGRVARWVRPAGYDGELTYLLALMQRLGRLVVQYHFPEEAVQIRRLMQPLPSNRPGVPDEPGMAEQAASYAVLGVDLDALGIAIGRFWGFDDSVLSMMRRHAPDAPVHPPVTDADRLRISASCGNEAIDARHGPAHRRQAAMQQVLQRYGRHLGLSLKELVDYAEGIGPAEPDAEPEDASMPEGKAVS